jgi:hypothetical protein
MTTVQDCPGATFSCRHCRVELVDHPPLVDQLARRYLLKGDFDGGSYRHFIGRSPRQMGVEMNARVLVQGDQRQIVRLIGHAPGESAVLDHNIRCNVTPPLGLFLLQAGGGPADLASRLRWILEPGAGGAEL